MRFDAGAPLAWGFRLIGEVEFFREFVELFQQGDVVARCARTGLLQEVGVSIDP